MLSLVFKTEINVFHCTKPVQRNIYSRTSVTILGLCFKGCFVFNCFRSKENSLQAVIQPAFSTIF